MPRPRLNPKLAHLLADQPDLVARLLSLAAEPPVAKVVTPTEAAAVFWPLLAGRAEEALVVLALDRRRKVLGSTVLTVGSDAFTVVDPRQVFRWALMQGRSGAAAVILAHNHPSGDPTPSSQDRDVTRRVAAAGRLLGIPLVDHLVCADDPSAPDRLRFQSLAASGDLPFWADSPLIT
jgi:DNA repair protein RadC